MNFFFSSLLIYIIFHLSLHNLNAEQITNNDLWIAVDLDSTYVRVSYHNETDGVILIPDENGLTETPSIFLFFKKNEVIYGSKAMELAPFHIENVVHEFLELLGRDVNEVQSSHKAKQKNYQLTSTTGHISLKLLHLGIQVSVHELVSYQLKKAKMQAEKYFGFPITKVIITAPLMSPISYRQGVYDAAIIAEFKQVKIIAPSVASAIYMFSADVSLKNPVFSFYMGGGSTEVAAIVLSSNVFEVVSVAGNFKVGYLQTIDHIIKKHIHEARRHFNQNTILEAKLKLIDLFRIPGPHNIILETKNLEKFRFDLQSNTAHPYGDVIEDTFMKAAEKTKYFAGMESYVTVTGEGTLGLRISTSIFGRISPSKEAINAPVLGAGIYAGVLSGTYASKFGIKIENINSITLGYDAIGQMTYKLLSKGRKYPLEIKKTFSTFMTNQTNITINIFEGEDKDTKFNEHLGKVVITGFEKARYGVPQVEVRFSLDENGLLSVKAFDLLKNQKPLQTREFTRKLTESEISNLSKKMIDLLNKEANIENKNAKKSEFSQSKGKEPEKGSGKSNWWFNWQACACYW